MNRFSQELKSYFNVRHCFLLSSGKAALTITLQALYKLHPQRDEVLIPAFTCFSVPSSIVRAGLKVRLCDIDKDTFDFDYNRLSEIFDDHSIASRILAIVTIHLFGFPSDVNRLKASLPDPHISIIEDASQAIGNENAEGKLGTFGDIGIFSLGRGKPFSTVEGGIILAKGDQLADNIRSRLSDVPHYTLTQSIMLVLKAVVLSILVRPSLFWLPKSIPCTKIGETIYDTRFQIRKLSPFQAGLARNWATRLMDLKATRSANSALWSHLVPSNCKRNLMHPGFATGLVRFPIRVRGRDIRSRILDEGERSRLGIMPGYPSPINEIEELAGNFTDEFFPMARQCAGELITLPVHSYLSDGDKFNISQLLNSELSSGPGGTPPLQKDLPL